MENNFLQAALEYWDKGISIFPLIPGGKRPLAEALPLCGNGVNTKPSWIPFQDQQATREQVIEWWTKYPQANIAGVMGKVSSVICLDQDLLKDDNGLPILDESGKPKERGDISGFPPTLSATTWSGGKHSLYQYADGVPTKHGFRKMVDIQSDRSYIVLSPSIVNEKSYSWDLDWKEMWEVLTPFPAELLSPTQIAVEPKLSIKQLIGVEQGSRNDKMHRLTCSLYAKGYPDADVAFLANEINRTYKPPIGECLGDSPDELANILRSAKSFIASENKKEDQPDTPQAVMACLDDIKSEPINWLWPGRIALGKLTIIAGDPGLGKSLFTTTMAANVSVGRPWPVDGTQPKIGDVILLSAEDDAADTIKPRLEAAKADCQRIHILQAVKGVDDKGKPTQRMFSFRRDIGMLEKLLPSYPDCRLIIIDPVSAYLDGSDSNNNSDIRGLLAPLAEMAARYKVAVVLVSHLNKDSKGNAMYRAMGSLAFIAAVRTAYIVTKAKDDPKRRLILALKNNVAKEIMGLAYSVVEAPNETPIIEWEKDLVLTTAEEALGSYETNTEQTATDEASAFLRFMLIDGPKKVSEVEKEARLAGISTKMLRTAREKLKIKSKKLNFNEGWEWGLYEDAQSGQDALSRGIPQTEGTLAKSGHLGQENLKADKTEFEKSVDEAWSEVLSPNSEGSEATKN